MGTPSFQQLRPKPLESSLNDEIGRVVPVFLTSRIQVFSKSLLALSLKYRQNLTPSYPLHRYCPGPGHNHVLTGWLQQLVGLLDSDLVQFRSLHSKAARVICQHYRSDMSLFWPNPSDGFSITSDKAQGPSRDSDARFGLPLTSPSTVPLAPFPPAALISSFLLQ